MTFAIVTHAEASATLTVVVCDDVTMLSSLEEKMRNTAEAQAHPCGAPTTEFLTSTNGFRGT
jgi:hypothetical protein